MNLSELVFGLKYLIASNADKASVQYHINRQRDIMKVQSVLPGKYRYEQIEAAINASGVHPETLYYSLASGEHTIALATFYEALRGPGDVQEAK